MGVGYTVRCRNCGNSKDILIGGGMLLADNFKDDIMEGKFGLDAKEIMEEHPDWNYNIEQCAFSCSCNYMTGFPVVTFYTDDGRKIKCDRHRCSQCGKVLRSNSWTHTCWKCGGYMDIMETLLWDRSRSIRAGVSNDEGKRDLVPTMDRESDTACPGQDMGSVRKDIRQRLLETGNLPENEVDEITEDICIKLCCIGGRWVVI